MSLAFKACTTKYPADAQTYITLSKPAGVVAGDLLIATFCYGYTGGSVPGDGHLQAPDGWALAGNYCLPRLNGETYWKIAGENEPASYTWQGWYLAGSSYIIPWDQWASGAMLAYGSNANLSGITIEATAPLNTDGSDLFTNSFQASGDCLALHCLQQANGYAFYAPNSPQNPAPTARVPFGNHGLCVLEQSVASQGYAYARATSQLAGQLSTAATGAHTILINAPAAKLRPSIVRGFMGQLFAAYIQGSALKVDRYTDAWPEELESTVTIEGSGAGSCALGSRCGSILDLVYEQNGAILQRESRDCGRTWSVADTIASGYKYPAPCIDERAGIWPVMLYKDGNWYLSVGTLGADNTWSFTAPAQVITGAADSPGQLSRREGAENSGGVWQFVYTDATGAVKAAFCHSLSSDGTGTWS